MVLDTTIICDTPEHKNMKLYAWFMVLMYPVGITSMFFILLYRKRHVLKDEELREAMSERGISSRKIRKSATSQGFSPSR